MANTYYDSQLTAEEIEEVLEAINGILTQANNGKVLAISNGKIEARSVQWGGGSAVLEPLSVTANGDYYPESGVDGFDEVHVSVSGGGGSGNTILHETEYQASGSFSYSKEITIPKTSTYKITVQTYSNGFSLKINGVEQPYTISNSNNYAYLYYAELSLNADDIITMTCTGSGRSIATFVITDMNGSSGAVVQPLSVTQNGTYNPPSGVDGYSPVTVNVSGGSSDYPVIDAVFDNSISGYIINISHDLVAPTSVSEAISQAVNSYFTTMLNNLNGNRGSGNRSIRLTEAIASMAVSSFEDAGYFNAPGMEYIGNVYGNAMIGTLGLVLLGDFSQGGAAQGNTLLDSINNYSGVIIQGIYQKQRNSGYNTSCLYPNISLNTAYWGGMQDRNGNYECKVTFTNDVTVSLSGNYQTIIYGIP